MLTRERPQAATKRGRRTLLTGVVAVALLGGMTVSVAAASVAGASTTRSIEVCKAGPVAGSFSFTLTTNSDTAKTFSLTSGQCKTFAAAATNTVVEALDATGATHLGSIALVPNTGTTSVGTRTAHVDVAAGSETTATFTNEPTYGQLKVCKSEYNSPSLIGEPFSFTESAGANTVGPFSVDAAATANTSCGGLTRYQVGTRVNIAELPSSGSSVYSITVTHGTESNVNTTAGTVTATVGPPTVGTTIVDYANWIPPTTQTGSIEVCKQAGDQFVSGSFNFVLSEGEWSETLPPVPVGQCSGDVTVPAGQVTVTEEPSSPYYVSSVGSIPQSALVAENLANSEATYAVAVNSSVTAIFTNSTQLGYVKVCKVLDANSGALTGSVFTFNVSDDAGTQTVSVISNGPGTPACSLDLTALPLGSTATITEVAQANVTISGVSVTAGSVSGTTAYVTVGTNVNVATFNNEAMGWVEVCKNAGDPSTGQQSFPFTVNGGSIFIVMAGQCSQAFEVPAGTATIVEMPGNPNFYLQNVTAYGLNAPYPNELISWWANANQNGGTAYVNVPFGGVNDETLVTFTDAALTGQFKICSAQTSPDANLDTGEPFVYDYSYTVNGTTTTGSVTLTNPVNGSTCSAISGPIPVVNANGSAVTISVSELQPSTPSVELTNLQYQGSGSVISSPPLPTTTFPATIVFSNGSGANVVTFTQGRTP